MTVLSCHCHYGTVPLQIVLTLFQKAMAKTPADSAHADSVPIDDPHAENIDDMDEHPSLYNISVYGKHTYHHSGIFREQEPGTEPEHGQGSGTVSGVLSGVFSGVFPGEAHGTHAPPHVPIEEVKPSKWMTHVAWAILLFLAFYAFLLFLGIPQEWTHEANTPHTKQVEENNAPMSVEDARERDSQNGNSGTKDADSDVRGNESNDAAHTEEGNVLFNVEEAPFEEEDAPVFHLKNHPPYIMILPFVGLLLCIAFFPLFPKTAHWWENNTNRFLVAALCGAVTLLYYAFFCQFSVEGHWPYHHEVNPNDVGGLEVAKTMFANAILGEFIPFIILLFSLFVITGGIRISGNFKATPLANTGILSVGALLSSFIGTTGAAMLLIRFLLETNRRRKYRAHTVILFIFTVCNAGGCLTPLGDPPLFLGYLRGVPFEWTLFALWPGWLFLNACLLGFYFCWDSWFYRYETEYKQQRGVSGGSVDSMMDSMVSMVSGIHKHSQADATSESSGISEASETKKAKKTKGTGLLVTGWRLQIPLLLGVVASVALIDPSRPIIIFGWELWGNPPFYLREAVQLALAGLSLFFGSYAIRKKNAFNFLAIGEVAALFFGIFICMQVPLQIINVEGKGLVERTERQTGLSKEMLFFWTTGSLSLFLDNAPTYIVFFETARTLSPGETLEEARQAWREINEEKRFFETAKFLIPSVTSEETNRTWQRFNTEEMKEKRFIAMIKTLIPELDKEKATQTWQHEKNVCDVHRAFNAAAKLTPGLDEERAQTVWREADNRFVEAIQALSPEISEEKAREAWATVGKKRCFRELKPVALGKNGFIDHFLLIAIALGTVFIGGMTYIANGPNFMVKAIAEQGGVRMPSFFGFMVYSCLILLPLVFLVSILFV
jgi:Na+/H+ antiporter NhaD/arsenite permease-like protein